MKTRTLTILLLTMSLALCATADTLAPIAAPVTPTAVDPSLQALLNLLGPHFAFLAGWMAWLFAFSAAMKVFAPKVQSWASAAVARNVTTPGSDHDAALRAILSSKLYRWGSTALDMLLSINLPTLDSYLKQLATANPGVTITKSDGMAIAAPKTVATVATISAEQPAAPGGMKLQVLAALLLPAVLLISGCAQTLAPAGPYGSGAVFGTNSAGLPVSTNAVDGMILFQADQAIVNGETLIENFVMFTYKNQAQLTQWPQIQMTANTLRAKAPAYINAVITARNAYLSNPTASTQSGLATALSVLSAGISSAQSYQAQATQFLAQQAAANAAAQANAPPVPAPAPAPVPQTTATPNALQKTN